MPNLSWNEIRQRAVVFSNSWAAATREQADKQTFWNEFFQIFGIPLRTVASFEVPVQRLRGTYGFIDLLWKGKLLVEHKTAGASLEVAATQAFDYIHDLQAVGRAGEIPRYILLSDFKRFALYDLEPSDDFAQHDLQLFRDWRFRRIELPLADLQHHIREFDFIPGYQVHKPRLQDTPLNLKAVEIMAGVHDTLKAGGFTGHDLERFLVRVLFCMFADKTGIFEPDAFRLFIENRTDQDGSNLGAQLNALFATLDKPENERQRNLDEELRAFPYINGELFKERLDSAAFNRPMREALLEAASFKWASISPAIFGALFQEVMEPAERRSIGAHYTSERDILRVIRPLFLDSLRAEFEAINNDRSGRRAGRLEEFRVRLTQLKFLDPACGCGNFLVVAYRELRAIELDVLKAQRARGQQAFTLDEVNRLSQVDVHQFYGIEIKEWPVRIAEVALWLMDHQSNLLILEAFSQPFLRLPLRNAPHIHLGNALRMDWNDLLPATDCSFILGNPPFIGKSLMTDIQKDDMKLILSDCRDLKGGGVLDYVTAWYLKSAKYIEGSALDVSFVSTNSIAQGEQPGILWNYLFGKYKITINFAYQTFVWTSEARGKAHVHVVIIGFSQRPREAKLLFISEAEDATKSTLAVNIGPYLVEGGNIALKKRIAPISDVPPITFGSMPNDGGHLILSEQEKDELIADSPITAQWVRTFMGADELLNGEVRFCLWLAGVSPREINEVPAVKARVQKVRDHRLRSERETTNDLASFPALFGEIRQPTSDYLIFPLHSSQTRTHLPIGFNAREVIASNACSVLPGATLFLFGVLSSSFHMAWISFVAGRIKSDFRYSNTLVYNNYPWPLNLSEAQRSSVERDAQAVLDARALYPDSTLGALYDPLLMPSELVKAHNRLDRTVEKCYRPQPFNSNRERVEFLFAFYENLTSPLLPNSARRRHRRQTKF